VQIYSNSPDLSDRNACVSQAVCVITHAEFGRKGESNTNEEEEEEEEEEERRKHQVSMSNRKVCTRSR
jgi:hypothetical protein